VNLTAFAGYAVHVLSLGSSFIDWRKLVIVLDGGLQAWCAWTASDWCDWRSCWQREKGQLKWAFPGAGWLSLVYWEHIGFVGLRIHFTWRCPWGTQDHVGFHDHTGLRLCAPTWRAQPVFWKVDGDSCPSDTCIAGTTFAHSLFIALMIDAVCTFKMSVYLHDTTCCYIPESCHFVLTLNLLTNHF
jgi:hypothetical protein